MSPPPLLLSLPCLLPCIFGRGGTGLHRRLPSTAPPWPFALSQQLLHCACSPIPWRAFSITTHQCSSCTLRSPLLPVIPPRGIPNLLNGWSQVAPSCTFQIPIWIV